MSWEALVGEEEPGGREEKRIDGEERRVFKKEALRRGPSFKNSYMARRRSFILSESESYSFTFYFCFVNYYNTSYLLLLVGSRVLKLLLDNEMHIN